VRAEAPVRAVPKRGSRLKARARVAVDCLMALTLLRLSCYSPESRAVHRWTGVFFLLLALAHAWQNSAWYGRLMKGPWTPGRAARAAVNILTLLAFLLFALSGLALSRGAVWFPGGGSVTALARAVHVASVHWGLVLASLHLGLHWAPAARRLVPSGGGPAFALGLIIRAAALALAAWGLYVFVDRGIASYMFLQTGFFFVDFERHPGLRAIDSLATAAFFVAAAYYARRLAQALGRRSG
jgi:hypothetical protein